MHQKIQTDQEWAFEITSWMPIAWRKRLLQRWESMRSEGKDFFEEVNQARIANIQLRDTVGTLNKIRIPLNASDQDIIDRSEFLAHSCVQLASMYHDAIVLRIAMAKRAVANSIEPPTGKKMTDSGAIARMTDAKWWRRKLRQLHAKLKLNIYLLN